MGNKNNKGPRKDMAGNNTEELQRYQATIQTKNQERIRERRSRVENHRNLGENQKALWTPPLLIICNIFKNTMIYSTLAWSSQFIRVFLEDQA